MDFLKISKVPGHTRFGAVAQKVKASEEIGSGEPFAHVGGKQWKFMVFRYARGHNEIPYKTNGTPMILRFHVQNFVLIC